MITNDEKLFILDWEKAEDYLASKGLLLHMP